ncbi:MAG: S8 family serine peptidase [Candidatus Kapabacteria bacterium]|nr:S8 family serine peptidase [Candidatus Kapabacteria bacterium]
MILTLGQSLLKSEEIFKTYRVFFKDKGPEKFQTGTKIFEETLNIISKKALDRRKKVLNIETPIFYDDAPVYNEYIDAVLKIAPKLRAVLRWHNYIVIEATESNINKIKSFPFVKKVQETSSTLFSQSKYENNQQLKKNILNLISLDECSNCGVIEYGKSFQQLNLMNVIKFHEMGINGDGVTIGFLDNGFRWKIHNGVKNSKVLAEYDFINRDSITANQEGDRPDQDGHGSIVFSIVSSFYNGKLIGVAPCASFYLGKTEDMSGERRIEEDLYAAGIEWLESQGVDVISTSLGYFNFDSTEVEYSYSNLDGRSTLPAKTINKAVYYGVVCVTAAGNAGPNPKTIITPADADSVIAVGATMPDGKTPANFTSRGPRYDEVIKPDLSAMGNTVYTINPNETDSFINANGTSMATPLISGSIGLLLSVFPELKPYEIREMLKKTASQSNNPDPILGWGIPDFFKAALEYGIIISPISTYKLLNFQKIAVFIFSKYSITKSELLVKFKGQQDFKSFKLYKSSNENLYTTDIPLSLFNNEAAEVFIIAEDNYTKRTYPYNSKMGVLIYPESEIIQCGVDFTKLPRFDNPNISAFVYPSIIMQNSDYVKINIMLQEPSDTYIKVYNLTGQLVYNQYYPIRDPGLAVYLLPVNNFAIGNYFAVIKQKSKTDIVKFVVIE